MWFSEAMWLWLRVCFLPLFLSYFLVDSTAAVTLPLEPDRDEDSANTESRLDKRDLVIIRRALINYDRDVAPILIGKPLVVNATVKVLSVPSFNQGDSTLELKIQMEQCWHDTRLNVHRSGTLQVPRGIAPHLWSPHLLFYGAKLSHVHSVLYHHLKHFIDPGGNIVQTCELTVSAPCSWSYNDFPLDERRCELTFGSSLGANKIQYKWRDIAFPLKFHKAALERINDWDYRLLRLSEGHSNTDRGLNYSTLTVVISGSRNSHSEVLTYAGILTAIVCISFVPSFVKDNLPARVIAGVAAFALTVTWVGRRPHPTKHAVSCFTCIDLYSVISVMLVGAQLLLTVALIVMKEREKLQVAACKKSRRRKTRKRKIKKVFRLSIHRRVSLIHCTAIIHAPNMEMEAARQESTELAGSKRIGSKLNRWCHILNPIALLIGLTTTITFLLYNHYGKPSRGDEG